MTDPLRHLTETRLVQWLVKKVEETTEKTTEEPHLGLLRFAKPGDLGPN